jgi:hypothetical protein
MASKRRHILHPGDILLFKPRGDSTSIIDKLIVLGQHLFRQIPRNDNFCHVALVDDDTRFILEARWPKTRRSHLADVRTSCTDKIEVYRVRGITPEQIKLTLDFAHEHLNEWYDVPLFLTGFLSIKHTWICSTFVSKAFKAAKLSIPYGCSDKVFIVPDDFAIDKKGEERIM